MLHGHVWIRVNKLSVLHSLLFWLFSYSQNCWKGCQLRTMLSLKIQVCRWSDSCPYPITPPLKIKNKSFSACGQAWWNITNIHRLWFASKFVVTPLFMQQRMDICRQCYCESACLLVYRGCSVILIDHFGHRDYITLIILWMLVVVSCIDQQAA